MSTLVGIVGQNEFTAEQLHELNVRSWEQGPEAEAMRQASMDAQYAQLTYEQEMYAKHGHTYDEWPDWL